LCSASARARAPTILCAGIILLDEVFRVERFPPAGAKIRAQDFFVVNGGCAANAAVAIARLGGRAMLAGPLGGPLARTRTAIACWRRWRAKGWTAAVAGALPACRPRWPRVSSMRAASASS